MVSGYHTAFSQAQAPVFSWFPFPCPNFSPHLETQSSGMLRGSHSMPNTVSDSSLLCYLQTPFSLRTLAWCLFLEFRLHRWSILFYCNGTRKFTSQWASLRMQEMCPFCYQKSKFKGQFHCFFLHLQVSGERWGGAGAGHRNRQKSLTLFLFFVWVLASLPDFLFLAQFKCFLVLGQKAITKLLLLSRLFGNTLKKVKSLSRVWLCNPMDCSLPGSSLHGILQARVLEWVAISFSRGSSQLRDRTRVSHIPGRHFNLWATREARSHINAFEPRSQESRVFCSPALSEKRF